ncbi:MAG: chemotaxis protein CheA [Planctomycetota bacterium]|nr:MAG: chemotaxis protein CheA [Planctomycetota bacterium]
MQDLSKSIDALAEAMVFLDVSDWQSLFALEQAATDAVQQLDPDDPRVITLQRMQQVVEALIHEQTPDSAGACDWLRGALEALQRSVTEAAHDGLYPAPAWFTAASSDAEQEHPADAAPALSDDENPALEEDVVAPDETAMTESAVGSPSEAQSDDNEGIWQDFAERSLTVLDDLQHQLLNLEHGAAPEEVVGYWRRELHTIKGESAMMEEMAIHELCIAAEDLVHAAVPPPVAPLFAFIDCLRQHLLRQHHDDDAWSEVVQQLRQAAAEGAAGKASEEVSQGDGTWPLSADSIMLAEFVSEASEHLESAEVCLLALETADQSEESVNALFRSFHTIKGLAGFMELAPVQSLAHITETFLDRCRDERVNAAAIDLIFAAIDQMKKQVQALREALENGMPSMALDPQADQLQRRIEAAHADPAFLSTADAFVDPDENAPPLGEILCESGVVRREDITRALHRQRSGDGTGRQPRLGEVLVREGVVEAKQVSQALRQQRGAATNIRETVKVDATRLDRLVDAIGELVIAETMVSQDQQVQDLAGVGSDLSQRLGLLSKITRELQEIATSLRMVPIRTAFQRMARLARDVAGRTGKQVNFSTAGEDTEMDKSVVDRIGDPLVHMVRNAIDHGLEADAAARVAAGKPEVGQVALRAYHQGGNICIQIRDDGKGLDRQRLLNKAIDRGLVSAADAQEMPDSEVHRLVFHPGLSTTDAVSDLSGRGVGMDVVKKTINELRGQVDIESTVGVGTTFTIRLPLTLAIIDGMVCRVGDERYIIPTLSITRSLRPQSGQLSTALGRGEMLSLHGEVIPIYRLHHLLQVAAAEQDATRALMVIIDAGDRKAALQVDELLGKQQIVIKSLGNGMGKVPGIAGGAIMSDGSVGLIADPMALVDLAHAAA